MTQQQAETQMERLAQQHVQTVQELSRMHPRKHGTQEHRDMCNELDYLVRQISCLEESLPQR